MSVGVKTVAMESTGACWVTVLEILEGRSIEVDCPTRARSELCLGEKVMSMTPKGYKACTPVDCCVPVSAQPEILPHCRSI